MPFFYVDRILEYEPKRRIRGIKNVTRNESFYYWLPDGRRVLSPAVLSEAVAQLGGWMTTASTDFVKRPVLLTDDKTEYFDVVEAGDVVEMDVSVLEWEDDVVLTTGTASVRGKPVLKGHACRGFLLPLTDFSDPEMERRRFQGLFRPEFKDVKLIGSDFQPLKAVCGPSTFESLKFIDGLIEHVPYRKVVGFKNFASCEWYFADHFPRKPVVPGVLLLTFFGEVCQYLVKEDIYSPVRARALIPRFIQNVRFRKFVEPGDQCVLSAEVKEGDCSRHGSDVLITAKIMANGTRVMLAEMGFTTMFGSDLHSQRA